MASSALDDTTSAIAFGPLFRLVFQRLDMLAITLFFGQLACRECILSPCKRVVAGTEFKSDGCTTHFQILGEAVFQIALVGTRQCIRLIAMHDNNRRV